LVWFPQNHMESYSAQINLTQFRIRSDTKQLFASYIGIEPGLIMFQLILIISTSCTRNQSLYLDLGKETLQNGAKASWSTQFSPSRNKSVLLYKIQSWTTERTRLALINLRPLTETRSPLKTHVLCGVCRSKKKTISPWSPEAFLGLQGSAVKVKRCLWKSEHSVLH
jgi:hypothetical protein